MRGVLLVVLTLACAGAAVVPGQAAGQEQDEDYIVVLKAPVDPQAVATAHGRRYGLAARHVYAHALKGYAARLTPAQVAALRGEDVVDYVERDQPMEASVTQTGATWGLDRIDQRALPLSGTFSYTATGAGVTAYIIDTGIRFTHADFGGRAVSGYDAVDGGSADDCNGHGTHVAGTTGGTQAGVAKGVTLVGVRVLNCNGSGSTSGVIAGVDWVTGHHAAGQPAVANMSLGGGASSALDSAVSGSIADGVSYAIAAGNGNILGIAQDACRFSPARVPEAMTISATDRSGKKAPWANYGDCVDWFAPGVGITSAWSTSDTSKNTISGTSMATPHTAGVTALFLQSNPGATPSTVQAALFDLTTKNVVTSSRTTNMHLLFSGF